MLTKQTLHTPRLLVRSFCPEDYLDLYEFLSDESVYTYEPGEPVDQAVAEQLAKDMSASPIFWAVELQAEHKVIGKLYFEHLEPWHMMTWELGYMFNPRYYRQGYATEAVGALVRYGFGSLQVHRIMAHCNPENQASWKLLERIGFRREGWFRKDNFFELSPSGEPLWIDTYAYAILAGELPDPPA